MAQKIENLVVDTTAFINNAALHEIALNIVTVQEVVDEVTNKRQLKRLVVLPYDLKIKDVFPENVKVITDFSKKTGDYPSLSATDIKVIALTYQLEKEKVGTAHLKSEPVAAPTLNLYCKKSKEEQQSTANHISGFFLPKNHEDLQSKPDDSNKEDETVKAQDELAEELLECSKNVKNCEETATSNPKNHEESSSKSADILKKTTDNVTQTLSQFKIEESGQNLTGSVSKNARKEGSATTDVIHSKNTQETAENHEECVSKSAEILEKTTDNVTQTLSQFKIEESGQNLTGSVSKNARKEGTATTDVIHSKNTQETAENHEECVSKSAEILEKTTDNVTQTLSQFKIEESGQNLTGSVSKNARKEGSATTDVIHSKNTQETAENHEECVSKSAEILEKTTDNVTQTLSQFKIEESGQNLTGSVSKNARKEGSATTDVIHSKNTQETAENHEECVSKSAEILEKTTDNVTQTLSQFKIEESGQNLTGSVSKNARKEGSATTVVIDSKNTQETAENHEECVSKSAEILEKTTDNVTQTLSQFKIEESGQNLTGSVLKNARKEGSATTNVIDSKNTQETAENHEESVSKSAEILEKTADTVTQSLSQFKIEESGEKFTESRLKNSKKHGNVTTANFIETSHVKIRENLDGDSTEGPKSPSAVFSDDESVSKPSLDEVLPVASVKSELEQSDDLSNDSDFLKDSDDDSEWITPENVHQAKTHLKNPKIDETPAVVACITTDFAMQNVLKQLGLKVAALDGRVIQQVRTFILRCHACFKTTSRMEKVFCPNCGNKTLKKVAVSVDEEGKLQIHINAKKQLSTRGTKFSLPTFKGGKHGNNPILSEDQPLPQQRLSRQARKKNDPMDPDYTAGYSPFVMRDVNSRSAMLGIRTGVEIKHWMKKNPNEPRRRK